MSDDILKETNDWIQQLAQWQRQNTIHVLAEQLQQLPVLKRYLEKLLEHHLQSNLNQPHISHLMMLMNKLSETKAFLADRDFALTLVHCLLRLGSPKMMMDAKSKSLAVFQLSKAIQPSYVESEFNEYLKCIGKSQEDFKQVYVQQTLNSIRSHLILLNNPSQKSGQCKDTSEEIPLFSTQFLLALARLCLRLRQEVEFSALLEAILENFVSFRHSDPQVELLVQEVTSVHQLPEDGGYLSYGCHVILWSNYLHILEEQVLNMVHFATRTMTVSQGRLLQFSENLIKASCEYTEINTAVFSMLRQIYIQCHGHPAIGRVIAILSTSIWQRMTHTEVESHVKSFPVCYRALIKLIRNNPFGGMRMSTAIVHLCQLVSVIDDLISVGTFKTTVNDVSWLLTQFNLWHQAAFFVCYRGDEQVTVSCVKLILCCNGLHCISETVLTKVQDVVLSLKALAAKVTLSIHDVNFVLASSNLRLDDAIDDRLKTIVRKFLLTFCLQLNCTASVVEQIVTLAIENDSQQFSLLHMADILEVLLENPGSWVEELCIKKLEMMRCMQHINQICEKSLKIPDWLCSKITELLDSSSV